MRGDVSGLGNEIVARYRLKTGKQSKTVYQIWSLHFRKLSDFFAAGINSFRRPIFISVSGTDEQ
jgi:hypothetical protein